ncbi:MAG: penicillin-binding protein 2 [bacterium]
MERTSFQSGWQRPWAFFLIGGMLFGLLIARLVHLQVVRGDDYREKSDNNRIRLVEIAPARGAMFDRHGTLLVSNQPVYTLYGVPAEMKRDTVGLARVAQILGYDAQTFRRKILESGRGSYLPQRLQRDLSFTSLSQIEEQRDILPGIFLQVEPKRYHPMRMGAHVFGYVAEVSPEELPGFPGTRAGDLVGKRGLEKTYDEFLRGQKGQRLAIVNVFGQEVGDLEGGHRVPPVAGKNLRLTIDAPLQALAESLLTDKIGAIVAMEPSTGEILALASAPTYDPDIFAGAVAAADWQRLLSDPIKPMLDRAVQSVYPPGSTIKMAMLAEGLESKEIDVNWTVPCRGSLRVGNRVFSCWRKQGHGRMAILDAIEQSCDVFFYTLGLRMGADGIYRALTRFHFGMKAGIDIGSEATGIAPSIAYYNRRYGPSGWTRGFIPSISIGQGEVLATPLQMCGYISAIADGVMWRQPHLVREIEDPVTGKTWVPDNHKAEPIDASTETMRLLREATRRVVMGSRGTAHRLADPALPMGGKTGTAQNPHGEDHAWFLGFAPFDEPKIAVCVLVEFGGHGSSAAAPLAGILMRAYVEKEEPKSADSPMAYIESGQQ